MKKILTSLLVVIALLLVAPWGVGKLAQGRVNQGLDRSIEQAPYLKIVERTWTPGWFRSEQQVTFEVQGILAAAMNPANVIAEMEKAQAAQAAAEAAAAAAEVEAAAPPAPDTHDGERSSEPADTIAEPETVPQPAEPVRFTVRNEILHGPVLGFSGLGIARINSKLVLSDETRKKLIETLGTDEPLRVSTRVHFFGGGTTTFSSEARTVKLPREEGELSWDDLELSIAYSGDFDDIEMDGAWPRIETKNASAGSAFLLDDLTLSGDAERVRGSLYDTDFEMTIENLHMGSSEQGVTEVADVHYVVESSMNADFMDVGAKFGSGRLKSKQLTDLGLDIREIHYDFTFRRLHAETLEKMTSAIKASYATKVADFAEGNDAIFAPMKEYGVALLKYDPEFVIDRIGLATADGDGYIRGVIRLKGVTEEDFSAAGMTLIGKIDAEINIDASQKMIEKLPNGAVAAATAIDSGYLKREGERFVSKIEFRHGELKVNGKAQGLPGMGGPPAEGLAPQE